MTLARILMLLIMGLAVLFLANLTSCSESPIARPGYQSLSDLKKIEPTNPPLVLSEQELKLLAYEKRFEGQICYYAQVVDQDEVPVPDAMVLITLEKLGRNSRSYYKCRTNTDKLGRFSVLGGVGTHWRFTVFKKGYSPEGRRGALKGSDNRLYSTVLNPVKVRMWKNIGVNKGDIKVRKPFIFETASSLKLKRPLPSYIRFDMINGIITSDETEWDFQLEFRVDEKGRIPDYKSLKLNGIYSQDVFISVNNGKMAYLSDPKLGYQKYGDDFLWKYFKGVTISALIDERLPYLYRGENKTFQFQSRGGKVHGVCDLRQDGLLNDILMLSLSGAVNISGSPALFEFEPTEKDLSTDGYPLSE